MNASIFLSRSPPSPSSSALPFPPLSTAWPVPCALRVLHPDAAYGTEEERPLQCHRELPSKQPYSTRSSRSHPLCPARMGVAAPLSCTTLDIIGPFVVRRGTKGRLGCAFAYHLSSSVSASGVQGGPPLPSPRPGARLDRETPGIVRSSPGSGQTPPHHLTPYAGAPPMAQPSPLELPCALRAPASCAPRSARSRRSFGSWPASSGRRARVIRGTVVQQSK